MSSDLHADADELDPDEPRTPMWLPLLGAALFLVGLMVFLVTRTDEEPDAPSASVDSEGVQPAAPDTGAAQPGAAQPGAAQPGAGQADAHQRAPGDPHYGHDHP